MADPSRQAVDRTSVEQESVEVAAVDEASSDHVLDQSLSTIDGLLTLLATKPWYPSLAEAAAQIVELPVQLSWRPPQPVGNRKIGWHGGERGEGVGQSSFGQSSEQQPLFDVQPDDAERLRRRCVCVDGSRFRQIIDLAQNVRELVAGHAGSELDHPTRAQERFSRSRWHLASTALTGGHDELDRGAIVSEPPRVSVHHE